ncbi:MAG: hypothetical protein JO287_02625 [Pseudonocardiales bacterium]|nr:hypothetical protein [Pseudonocardiales bacterium]
MTRRVLTTIGSATAIATAVGACLLLGPTPPAQAATTIGNCATGCVTFGTGSISAQNGTKNAVVQFFKTMVCATASDGTPSGTTTKCGSF